MLRNCDFPPVMSTPVENQLAPLQKIPRSPNPSGKFDPPAPSHTPRPSPPLGSDRSGHGSSARVHGEDKFQIVSSSPIRRSATVSKTVISRVQQYATTLLHDNDTTMHDDENRINIDSCNGHAGMVRVRAGSRKASNGVANRRLQPLGHLSICPSNKAYFAFSDYRVANLVDNMQQTCLKANLSHAARQHESCHSMDTGGDCSLPFRSQRL